MHIYAPALIDKGYFVFVLSICLTMSVNVILSYNFSTIRGRNFTFGMCAPLIMPFWMTPRLMSLWPWLTFTLKIAYKEFVASTGVAFHKNILFPFHFRFSRPCQPDRLYLCVLLPGYLDVRTERVEWRLHSVTGYRRRLGATGWHRGH